VVGDYIFRIVCDRGATVLLSELLAPERVRVPLTSRTKDDLLRELVELAAGGRAAADVAAILQSVRDREQVLSTGIGGGVAIPHGKTPLVDELVVAAGLCARPVEFESLDGAPVELCFLLIGPESAAGAHVKALSRISRLLRRDTLREALRDVTSAEEFLRAVRESEVA
jgi:mannitol/fructose-specific phosphotransferase system IIA component (Ntr-type)